MNVLPVLMRVMVAVNVSIHIMNYIRLEGICSYLGGPCISATLEVSAIPSAVD